MLHPPPTPLKFIICVWRDSAESGLIAEGEGGVGERGVGGGDRKPGGSRRKKREWLLSTNIIALI